MQKKGKRLPPLDFPSESAYNSPDKNSTLEATLFNLATSNHKAKTAAALWGNVVLSNTICVAYLYGHKPISVWFIA